MVHLFGKKKQTIEKLVKIGELYGWEREFWKDNVNFTRERDSVSLMKIDGGYKVIFAKDKRPVHAEIVQKKEHGMMLVGEALAYFKW
jgi:hypothetical protein